MSSPRRTRLPGALLSLLASLLLCAGLAGCAPAAGAGPAASHSPSPSAANSTPATPLQVVGLGDSVMLSASCACAGPAAQYATLLARRSGRQATATNLGQNGLTAATLAQQLADDSSTRTRVSGADVVLVTIGANDVAALGGQWSSCPQACWTPTLTSLGTNLGQVLDEVAALRKNPSVPVLVTNYWNVLPDGQTALRLSGAGEVNWSRKLTAATNAVVAQQATAHGDVLVDLTKPFLGADGTSDPTDLLLDDGDHPNARGVDAIAAALLAATP